MICCRMSLKVFHNPEGSELRGLSIGFLLSADPVVLKFSTNRCTDFSGTVLFRRNMKGARKAHSIAIRDSLVSKKKNRFNSKHKLYNDPIHDVN